MQNLIVLFWFYCDYINSSSRYVFNHILQERLTDIGSIVRLLGCKRINTEIDGLVQDCNYCIANAQELLLFCTKLSKLIHRIDFYQTTKHNKAHTMSSIWEGLLLYFLSNLESFFQCIKSSLILMTTRKGHCNLMWHRALYPQWPLLLTWFNFNPSMDM